MDYDLAATYDYELPDELVADKPAAVRSASRLMWGDGQGRTIAHRLFSDLPDLLGPDDLVVFNDTRVVAARVQAQKATGGAVELFVIDVLDPRGAARWRTGASELRLRCMTRSSKPVRKGQELTVGRHVFVVEDAEAGYATVTVSASGTSASDLLDEVGEVPLPPYIVRRRSELGDARSQPTDAERYQTVYASKSGAVAAPTAGLHFDDALFEALAQRGVRRAMLSLDVGPGTFRPVSATRLSEHEMHTESYTVGRELGEAIRSTKSAGGRVVAVGTTTVRALESEAMQRSPFAEEATRETDLFISPGFEFQIVDAMITNFHLPRSTLLALVYAFGDAEFVKNMYETAIAERYRFYSFGDAMLLTRR